MKHARLPSLTIKNRVLEQIDIASLSRLAEALHTLSDVSNGLLAQPCFFNQDAREWTDAGNILEEITVFLDRYRAKVIEVISEAAPQDKSEAKEMIWARLRYEAELGDDLAAFARMVSGLTATLQKRKSVA